MAVTGIWYHWMWSYDGSSASMHIAMAPTGGVAQVSLSAANGEGLCSAGITDYESRPVPNGPNVPHHFDWDTNFGFPPAISDASLTSVSAAIETGSQQNVTATLTLYQFS